MFKKKKEQEEQLKKIQSVQSFSPIREVRDGIICTKDGRFVKLMEFSPINFKLRSPAEQASIISQFAAALRGMPKSLQFKVVSRKSDVTKFVEMLSQHQEEEDNPHCRSLQSEQIALIKKVGNEQGISRRFFLSFEYEESVGLKKKPTFKEIVLNLETTAVAIRNGMEMCGNECLSKDGDNE